MPNYSLAINSTFQPFSYQELAAPLDRQEAYHEKLAEEYDKLSSQADILEAMGQNDKDKNSGTYARYKAYSDNLRKEADDLYRFGLNTESRQRLSDLRRMYNTEIVPIQNAWNKRDEESKMQLNARLQHPELRFTRDAANTSLDEYIRNPQGGFGVVNLNNIAAQMSEAAKNLAKQARTGRLEGIDEYTKNFITPYGLDPNLVNDWQNNPEKSPTLTSMMNQVLAANGLSGEEFLNTPNGARILQEAIGAARRGAWSAVGDDKTQVIEDFEKRLAATTDAQVYAATAKKAAEQNAGIGETPSIISDGVGLKTSDAYRADGLKQLSALKGGQDGLRSSYFGRTAGQVNPMKIYEEYQQELKKHHTLGNSTVANITGTAGPSQVVYDKDAAKKAVLDKYRKYGVSDILSDEQYSLLSGMGYNSTNNNPGSGKARFSTIEKGFNNLVQQMNRYSVNMTKYDSVHDTVEGNINEFGHYGKLSGRVWEINEDGKKGKPISDASKMNLYNSKSNKEGFSVNGIYYDPEFKGHIIIRTNEGRRFVVTPDILGNEIASLINDLESDGRFKPQHIAGALYEALNSKNKVQGETDSKI